MVSANNIKSLSKNQITRRKNKFQPKTIFVILGFLNEYFGRMVIEEGNLVEHFYVNEKKVADIFENYLYLLIEESNQQAEIKREEKDGHIYFYSREITKIIDSYYLENFLTGKNSQGNAAFTTPMGFFSKNTGKISDTIFPDKDSEFSYLVGAYYRYGEKNMFRFANAFHKAMLIIKLLILNDCKKVSFLAPPPDYVPFVSRIRFSPTTKMRRYFTEIDRKI